jgi:hypothetical protein
VTTPDTDPAASALDGIRETLHVAKEQGFAEWDDAYLPSALYRHTASLLAAAEAALKAADGATILLSACGVSGRCSCGTHPVAWNLDPAKLREAITAALAGKEDDDGTSHRRRISAASRNAGSGHLDPGAIPPSG